MIATLPLPIRGAALEALKALHELEEMGEKKRPGRPRTASQSAAELLEEAIFARFQHVFGVSYFQFTRRTCVGGRGKQ